MSKFGTGISTLVIAKSLSINKLKFSKKIKDFREKNFISYSIDNSRKFLNISKKNINNLKLNKICKLLFTNVEMEIYDGRISSSYNILPNINPDFIFLDGPDPKLIKGNYKNINFADKSFTVIQNDILKMETFLIPGTIILVDGRGNNVRYLKSNLYRNWDYRHIKSIDQHFFELKEAPLGNYNKKIINFYKA